VANTHRTPSAEPVGGLSNLGMMRNATGPAMGAPALYGNRVPLETPSLPATLVQSTRSSQQQTQTARTNLVPSTVTEPAHTNRTTDTHAQVVTEFSEVENTEPESTGSVADPSEVITAEESIDDGDQGVIDLNVDNAGAVDTDSGQTSTEDVSSGDTVEVPETTDEASASSGETEQEVVSNEPSPEEAVAPAVQAVGSRASASAGHQPQSEATGSAIAASNQPAVTQGRMAENAAMVSADTANTGEVEQATFEQELQRAIDNAMPEPTTEGQAKETMEQGGRKAAASVSETMDQQRTNAVGDLPSRVDESAVPDASSQSVPDEVPLEPEIVGDPPAGVSAAPIVPPPSTAAAIDTSASKESIDQLQSENNITAEQLEKGNDPQFQATIGAREEAEQHDREAPQALREAESADLAMTRGRAQGEIASGLNAFHGERGTRLTNVAGQQTSTKGLTETRKQDITNHITEVGRKTREDVIAILDAMDEKVGTDFQTAIDDALKAYDEAFEEEEGGFLSAIGDFFSGDWWGDDRFKRALQYGRNAFDRRIKQEIRKIAIYVEKQLQAARDRVQEGRDEIELYMTEKVSDAERQFAEQAASSITADFDALEGEISECKDALINKMVDIYKQGVERRNQREEELREANKSFWERVWDATVGVIQKVLEFKNMLLGILSRAAAVVEAIIQDPIGFLTNLIAGISAGLERFVSNIAENLKNALMGWLFGALEGAGIKMPQKFDFMGFLDIVLQVLGLTKENIRARAVRILGEETVSKIETAVNFLRVLFTEGPAGIWQMLLEKIGSIKDVIIEEIKSWVITKIIVAGIKWLVGLLNPAAAFVKACMAIYDIVVFFIQRGQQIISAVNAIINALGTIVAGNIGAMAQAVEGALNRILPVVIGFLASLLGLGGISEKIRQVIEKIQAPVNKAIDWVIEKGLAVARKIAGFFGGEKQQSEDEQATDPEVQAQIETGLIALRQQDDAVQDNDSLSLEDAEGVAASVRSKHPVFKSIEVISKGDRWAYKWKANPEDEELGGEKEDDDGVLIAEVVSSKPPGNSQVARFSVSSAATPNIFEYNVTRQLETATGLVADAGEGHDALTAPGITGALPSSPQLIEQARVTYPSETLTATGRVRQRGSRVADNLLLSADRVEVFEATLDATFVVGRRARESHKRAQLADTVTMLARRFPSVPIVYNIRTVGEPPDEVKQELEWQLKALRREFAEQGLSNPVQVIWRG